MKIKKELITLDIDMILLQKAKEKAMVLGTDLEYLIILFLKKFAEDDSIIGLSSKYQNGF